MKWIPEIERPFPNAHFQQVSMAELHLIKPYFDGVRSREEMARLMAGEAQLFMIRIGGEVVWLAWVQWGRFLHVVLDQMINLPTGIADINSVLTFPQFRNKGLAKWAYTQLLQHLQAKGFQRIMLQVESHNAASLATVRATGFAQLGSLRYWRVTWPRVYRFESKAGGRSELIVCLSKKPKAQFDAAYRFGSIIPITIKAGA